MTSTPLDAIDAATTDSGSPRRFPLAALLVFALLGFLLISTETMPAGVLTQIAAGLGTSPLSGSVSCRLRGSGCGTAASSASEYGCSGRL